MIFELVYFRAQHDLDTSIWIIWIPHMSAITCRSSLLKLFAHPTHTHTNSIQWQYPFVELGWWHHRVAKHQSDKSTATYTCYILIHSVSNYTLLTTRSVVLKLSNLHICCKSPQVLEEGLQREWWEMHLFRPCVINVWIPVFFNTCDLWQCPNSALCESTRVSKLQLAECTFTPFVGIVVPCAWEAPAWVKKLLQMSVTFRNIP